MSTEAETGQEGLAPAVKAILITASIAIITAIIGTALFGVASRHGTLHALKLSGFLLAFILLLIAELYISGPIKEPIDDLLSEIQ